MGEKDKPYSALDDGMYYEIEYDSTPMPGIGKFVLKKQKIESRGKDEVRELFDCMRDIARNSRSSFYPSSKFYNDRVRQENAKTFYKQGMFMKDFEDDYKEVVEYKQYFPCYQMMGYQQLRTYFTWRTQVRKGNVEKTSLSYAYLYFYELLNNVGVQSPEDGLDRLLFFWKEFRVFEPSIDRHVLQWLKDYHVYYDLPQPFSEFVKAQGLSEHYPELAGQEDRFALFCTLSKYDIRNSVFFSEDREDMIRACFDYTMDRLTTLFREHGVELENLLFLPIKSRAAWQPFEDALFFPWTKQRDRSVVLSSKEVYVCSKNQWTCQTALTTEGGKRFAGYLIKQMESVLREAVNYRYKITAGISMLSPVTAKTLKDAGIALEQSITDAVMEFYRETTKTVVTVHKGNLAKIRQEALITQEKLTVPEDMEKPDADLSLQEMSVPIPEQTDTKKPQKTETMPLSLESAQADPWKELRLALSDTERQALLLILHGDAAIRKFADEHGIMPEVLADGINEKAVDTVGDSLLDEEFQIYEDYLEQIREMLDGFVQQNSTETRKR